MDERSAPAVPEVVPPQQEAVDRSEPDLLPPPPPPAGSHFYEHLQFEAQLRQLRERAQIRMGYALSVLRLCALLLILWAGILATAAVLHLLDWGSDAWYALAGLPLAGLLLGPALLLLLRGGRLADNHYRSAWQALEHQDAGMLYADDERMSLIQQRLAASLWHSPAAARPFDLLTDRIEFCAFHLGSLQSLTRHPERLSWLRVRQDEATRRFARQLDSGCLIFAGCFAGLLLGWLQLVTIALGLIHAPAAIRGNARLCAFLDSYLEEPRIDLSKLEQHQQLSSLQLWLAQWH